MIQNRSYIIFDSKAAGHLPPFLARTDQEAIRMVLQASLDEKSNFNQFAGDYTLFCRGQEDEDTGDFLPFPSKLNIGTILALRAQFLPSTKPPQPQMVADMLDLSNTHKEFDRE